MEQLTEQTIATEAGPLSYLLHCPAASDRAPQPALLLTFATSARSAFEEKPYDIPFRRFAAAGHYVVAFDLPQHGNRIDDFGEGIDGMCRAFMAGQDPFARFVADGRAVIEDCLAAGIGSNGKIVSAGVSRAGYCALRLAAAEPRIHAVAALAPVTDWRRLREFATVRQEPTVAALAIDHWATQLADRALYLAIGNHDARVGTDCCLRFAHRLFVAQALRNAATPASPPSQSPPLNQLPLNQLHVVDSPGHALADEWRARGASFLLQRVNQR